MTPFMGLILPIPHVTSGTWGDDLNAAFAIIDAHDHSPGNGNAIDFSAILTLAAPVDVSSAVASAGAGLLAAREDHHHHIAFAGPAQAGIVATTAQTFAGVKTFSSNVLAPGLDVAAAATLVLGGTTATEVDLASAFVLTKALGNFQAVGTIEGSNLDVTFVGSAGGSVSGANTGDITLAAVGVVPNVNGATLVGQILNLEPADGTFGGVVSTVAQTFAGVKTFSSGPLAPSLDTAVAVILALGGTNAIEVDLASALVLTKALGNFQAVGTVEGSNVSSTFTGTAGGSAAGTNTGDITLAAVGAVPAPEGASLAGQVLTLQPADATNPGVVTTGAQVIAGVKTFSSGLDCASLTNTTGASTATMSGAVADGPTAVGVVVDNTITLANAAAKLLSIKNATIEKAYINKDGNFVGNNIAVSATLSGSNTGDVTLAVIGSTPNANGATLTGQVINLEPADGTFGGIVTTGTQTFAGVKTFSSGPLAPSLDTAAAATLALGGTTATEVDVGRTGQSVKILGNLDPKATAAISSFGVNVGSGVTVQTANQYLGSDGYVQLAGHLLSTSGTVTAGTTLATLDAAYRPNRTVILPVVDDLGAAGSVTVTAAGVVTCTINIIASTNELPLDAIRYKLSN